LGKIKYFVGGFYKHPKTLILTFKNNFIATLSKFRGNKRCIVTGDINIDLKEYGHDNGMTDYVDELFSINFIPYAFLPTRITSTSATIIDHIYSNCHSVVNISTKCGLVAADISDHLCNFILLISSRPSVIKERPLIRLHTSQNYSRYLHELSLVHWNDLYQFDNVDKVYVFFSSVIKTIYNRNFPLVRASRKYIRNKPWITPALKASINVKQKLYKKLLCKFGRL